VQLVGGDRQAGAADERGLLPLGRLGVAAAGPAEQLLRLPLDEDPVQLVGLRAGRPALLQVGQLPDPLAAVGAGRRVLDEAVLRQLPVSKISL
jgi:hypothetical protein